MIFCPRCEGNGVVTKYLVKRIHVCVYNCDECDMVWREGEDISQISHKSLDDLLEKNGLEISMSEIEPLGDYWLIWFNRSTEQFAGKQKLANISRDLLRTLFGKESDDQMIYVYTVRRKYLHDLEPFIHVPVDFSKYAYFIELDENIGGKITAESENYIRDFAQAIAKADAADRKESV